MRCGSTVLAKRTENHSNGMQSVQLIFVYKYPFGERCRQLDWKTGPLNALHSNLLFHVFVFSSTTCAARNAHLHIHSSPLGRTTALTIQLQLGSFQQSIYHIQLTRARDRHQCTSTATICERFLSTANVVSITITRKGRAHDK